MSCDNLVEFLLFLSFRNTMSTVDFFLSLAMNVLRPFSCSDLSNAMYSNP